MTVTEGSTRRRIREERERSAHARRRRTGWLVAAGVIAVLLVAAVWVAVQMKADADRVRDDLIAAKAALGRVSAAVLATDPTELSAASDEAARRTADAQSIVSGPLWRAAAHVPVVGRNVIAVREVTQTAQVLVDEALPAAVGMAAQLTPEAVSSSGAGIDLAPFTRIDDELPALAATLEQARASVSGIDREGLVSQVSDAVREFSDALDAAVSAVSQVKQTLPTLLSMAGAQTPRTYLLLFQNNAEARSTGGNPSAMLLARVDAGRLTIVRQASTADFDHAETSHHQWTAVPPELASLFESDTFDTPQNFTRPPEFSLTARLFVDLWSHTFPDDLNGSGGIDGVVSVDPVAMSYLLGAIGTVQLPGGDVLSQENLVPTLLSQVYQRYASDPAATDAYFAAVVTAVFNKLVGGGWKPLAVFDALRQGAGEARVLVWAADPQQQAMVGAAGLDGDFSSDSPSRTQVGVFVNDASHSKLEYYLHSTVGVTCDLVARTVTTSITMTSTAPVSGLPKYVIGQRNWVYGAAPSTMLLDVLYVGPVGASAAVSDPRSGDVPEWDRTGAVQGRSARSVSIALAAGGSRTVTFTSPLPAGAGGVELRYTPGVDDTPVDREPSCG